MGTFAFGTQLTVGGVAVAALKEISHDGLERESIETTAHDATDGWRTFIRGLKNAGEISISGNLLPGNATQDASTTAGLMGELDSDATHATYVILLADGSATSYISCTGFVTGFNVTNPVDALSEFDATIKLSGEPTLMGGS